MGNKGNKTQYHDNFQLRPVKSPRLRRQRMKAQKKRLLAAGMDPAVVAKLGVAQTRDALKTLRVC